MKSKYIKSNKNKSKTKNILIIVEGDTEQHFLKEYQNNLNYFGKIKKCNMFQSDLNLGFSYLKNQYHIVIIFIDSDMIDISKTLQKHISKFNKNYDSIKSKTSYLVVQYKNFEDELLYSSNGNFKKMQDLYKFFNASGADEFKRNFLIEKRITEKLKIINFKKLYTRSSFVQNLNKIKNDMEILSGPDLFK